MNESPVLFNMNIKWMSLFSFVRYVRNCSFLGFFLYSFPFAARANNSHSQKE